MRLRWPCRWCDITEFGLDGPEMSRGFNFFAFALYDTYNRLFSAEEIFVPWADDWASASQPHWLWLIPP